MKSLFRDALVSTYTENPCQVLPNALWKTLAQVENLETSVRTENDVVTQLLAWQGKSLLVNWTRSREQSQDFRDQQIGFDLALIHQDYMHSFPSKSYRVQRPYFRLIHRHPTRITKASVTPGFCIVDVKNIGQEAAQIAHLIMQCYPDSHPSVETISNWSMHPTFDPYLWIWVFDIEKKVPVGLGIAEIDQTIFEGSLEWIQVLPHYRRLGLGRMIVHELLSRLDERAKFTTAAGEVENKTNPEALYRSCGFEGSDVWWMFRN